MPVCWKSAFPHLNAVSRKSCLCHACNPPQHLNVIPVVPCPSAYFHVNLPKLLCIAKKHVEGDTGPVTRPPDPTGAPMIILGHVRALAGCCEVGNEWEWGTSNDVYICVILMPKSKCIHISNHVHHQHQHHHHHHHHRCCWIRRHHHDHEVNSFKTWRTHHLHPNLFTAHLASCWNHARRSDRRFIIERNGEKCNQHGLEKTKNVFANIIKLIKASTTMRMQPTYK